MSFWRFARERIVSLGILYYAAMTGFLIGWILGKFIEGSGRSFASYLQFVRAVYWMDATIFLSFVTICSVLPALFLQRQLQQEFDQPRPDALFRTAVAATIWTTSWSLLLFAGRASSSGAGC